MFELVGKGRIDTPAVGNFEKAIELPYRNFKVSNIGFEGLVTVPAVFGVGTGHGEFNNVSFYLGGVKFGSENFNGNAADCVFNRCYFRSCDPAVSTTTSQNINYIFRDCFFKDCPVMFRAQGGGNVTFENCYVIGGERLIHVPPQTNGNILGSQNSDFIVNGLRFDQNQKYRFCMVHDESYYGKRYLSLDKIQFSPGQFNKPKRYDFFDIERNSRWEVDKRSVRFGPVDKEYPK